MSATRTTFAPKPPWRDIAFALVVLVIGTACIVCGFDALDCGC